MDLELLYYTIYFFIAVMLYSNKNSINKLNQKLSTHKVYYHYMTIRDMGNKYMNDSYEIDTIEQSFEKPVPIFFKGDYNMYTFLIITRPGFPIAYKQDIYSIMETEWVNSKSKNKYKHPKTSPCIIVICGKDYFGILSLVDYPNNNTVQSFDTMSADIISRIDYDYLKREKNLHNIQNHYRNAGIHYYISEYKFKKGNLKLLI
jgi:hypothetical protein